MNTLPRFFRAAVVPLLAVYTLAAGLASAQQAGVRPDINKPYQDPNVKDFVQRFETENREVYLHRKEIVAACKITPGMAVADIGAGTGLFTRLFAAEVGPTGQVYAVDIARKFVEHIEKTCREADLRNVKGIVCKPDSTELPPGSIDLAFLCDTYHHFEFPEKTLASIHQALRPGGRLVLIDYCRIENKTPKWMLEHLRAGQEVFTKEIETAGFKKLDEAGFLKDNYFVRFEKLAAAPGGGHSQAPASAAQQGKPHPMACADYSQGKVFLVSAEGKVEWEYPAPACNDLWVLPNGNLLFVTGHGVKEVTRDKKVVFDYQSKSEIYACQRLANGNTLVGECNAGRLLEVDPAGKIVKQVRLLSEGKEGGHVFMRNARRLPDGHYLVAHYGQQVVKEYDAEGKVVMEIRAPGGPHSVIRLPNGNTLIACGDMGKQARVFEVDKSGKTVWQVTNNELPGISLKFMTGLQRLPNGNTVMTNWLGHGQLGKAPHVIEVTPDKKVVWTFADHKTMKTISSIQLLDIPGDVTKGGIDH